MGKKITMFGYLGAALAAGIGALAALMIFVEYDFYNGLNNLGYIVMVLAMLVIAAGTVMNFLSERDMYDLIITVTAVVTLVINIIAMGNEEGYLWYRDFFRMALMNGLSVCVLAAIGIKTMKVNPMFGIVLIGVFCYFLIIVPVIFHIDISDELWTIFLIFNAGVKLVAFGLSVVAANQEA